MVTVKRFGILSVGIISGILSVIGGLFIVLLRVMPSVLRSTASFVDPERAGDFALSGWMFGEFDFIILPIIYGVLGFIGGIIGAALYNLFAGWIGGIKVELESPSTADVS